MLRTLLPTLAVALALLSQPASIGAREPSAPALAKTTEVYFSPGGGCTKVITDALGAAKKTVRVQAYSFTSAPIAAAVVAAHKRGLAVQVILDRSQRSSQYSSADFLAHAGVPTFIDLKHAIAHNKIIILDGETVITGSFDFTKAAEASNAENLLVIRDQELAGKYDKNWEAHLAHSEPYAGR
ncbi:MAG TPA: phospholipase D family protein [Candidatus Acidoferrum sp.]|jgi:phosphatidylserine/phosphatidylglycerophosphate/cardiolipin synthase-like enzyme|nr:phospholipase D family protein [Candidatus Acidoferrum sp.]